MAALLPQDFPAAGGRGGGIQPVSLLPHRNDWDELTRDTVRAVEWWVGSRAFHRPGDVLEVPGTIGFVRLLLRMTGARRQGRDYARLVLAKAQEIGLLRDTGRVLKPRRQPRGEHQYWWRVWSVVPFERALASLPRLPNGAYCGDGNPRGAVHPSRFSVSIPLTSRAHLAPPTALAPECGLRPVRLPLLRAALSAHSLPAKDARIDAYANVRS